MRSPRLRRHAVGSTFFAAVLLLSMALAHSASAAFATLTWTSPGADGGSTSLRVTYYDLRISTRAIVGTDTLGWWNAATRVSMTGRTPSMPGTSESIVLGNLISNVKYFAILKSADTQLHWSGYSNVATFMSVTSVTAVDENAEAPEMVLGIPRPTPTSGRAEMDLALPAAMNVDAAVFDAQGRLVRTLEHGQLAAGAHVLRWDGQVDGGGEAASGVYWVRAAAGPVQKRVKLVVIR